MGRRITRSKRERVLAGVCGGIAEYFELDPTIIRLGFVIACFFGGVGFIAYLVAICVMPEDKGYRPSKNFYADSDFKMDYDEDKDFSEVMGDKMERKGHNSERSKLVLGTCFVLFGLLFLAKQFLHWFDFRVVIPVVLIVVGGMIIFNGGRRE